MDLKTKTSSFYFSKKFFLGKSGVYALGYFYLDSVSPPQKRFCADYIFLLIADHQFSNFPTLYNPGSSFLIHFPLSLTKNILSFTAVKRLGTRVNTRVIYALPVTFPSSPSSSHKICTVNLRHSSHLGTMFNHSAPTNALFPSFTA